jgi:2-dehydropantoate 2-reductase
MSTQNTTASRQEPGQHAEPLRFLIVGAGAVGGFVAARLAGAGHHVTVLARPRSAVQLHAAELALTAPGSPATSSLTRDLIAGRRTEVEAVLADLAVRARAAGTGTALIDLAVLALRIHNRQVAS